ncbi:MAG: alpha/beta hydrolase [Deltaproteobacteria bacterium]|nr:alpha/beta hydrolase [Deltaproteobacteria bacterium]
MSSRLAGRVVSLGIEGALRGLSYGSRAHPAARAWRHGVEVAREVRYGPGEIQTLDVYSPAERKGPLPVLLYLHGGGFSILSKDTHWMFGYGFARAGYLVFNANYRLAPKHPYPAALEDAAAALLYVAKHAAEHGGDSSLLAIAGESAGANLSLSLALAGCMRRPEPFLAEVFEADLRPKAVLPACGLLEVGNADRYLSNEQIPAFVRARLATICRSYLPETTEDGEAHALADPLRVIERGTPLSRELPPIFAVCGTKDPVLDDTRRLDSALRARGGPHRVKLYEGGGHAFHALFMGKTAQECWDDHLAFLAEHLATPQSAH